MEHIDELLGVLAGEPNIDRVRHLGTPVQQLHTPLYYVVELLRILRRDKAAFRIAQRNKPGRTWLDAAVKDVRPTIENIFGNGPEIAHDHASRLEDLRLWLENQEGDIYSPLILTRIVARAIEEVNAPSFWEQLQMYYNVGAIRGGGTLSRPLKADDPVPVCDTVFAGGGSKRQALGTSPRNLPRWRDPDRLARVLLAPPTVELFHVRLDFSLETELELLTQTTKVATIHPTTDLSAYTWTEDDHRFWNVRRRHADDNPAPKALANPPHQDDVLNDLRSLIDIAIERRSPIVVLPELTLTPETTEAVIDHWRLRQREKQTARTQGDPDVVIPAILVAGSCHKEISNVWNNVSTVVGTTTSREVVKAVPYTHTDIQAPYGNRVEDIPQHTHPEVTIYCSEHMTMSVMVCVDFLLDSLRDLVRDLDISLVVLPSMTTKSRIFGGLISGHVAATQGTVILANALAAKDDKSRGLVGHPSFRRQVRELNNTGLKNSGTGPGVAVIDTKPKGRSEWIAL